MNDDLVRSLLAERYSPRPSWGDRIHGPVSYDDSLPAIAERWKVLREALDGPAREHVPRMRESA